MFALGDCAQPLPCPELLVCGSFWRYRPCQEHFPLQSPTSAPRWGILSPALAGKCW